MQGSQSAAAAYILPQFLFGYQCIKQHSAEETSAALQTRAVSRQVNKGVTGDVVNDRQQCVHICFDVQDLCDNVLKHAKDDYVDKTILTCWEHKAIPKIVYTMGLTDTELTWGLNPFSGVSLAALALNACMLWS